jgi:2-polyprenyl-6-methoxyphenol hydroxylase-like FAD-dependent oxidoreductase
MTPQGLQPPSPTQPSKDPDRSYDVLVIGAGQAGLTVVYYLQQAGLRFLIVDAANQVVSGGQRSVHPSPLQVAHRQA